MHTHHMRHTYTSTRALTQTTHICAYTYTRTHTRFFFPLKLTFFNIQSALNSLLTTFELYGAANRIEPLPVERYAEMTKALSAETPEHEHQVRV